MKTPEDEEFERIEREQKIKQVPTFEEKMQKWAENRVRDDLAFAEGFSKGYHKAKQEWVGLIDEDMKDPKTSNFDFIYGARWAEQILKERNT